MTTDSIGLTATDKSAGIPCFDLARIFTEAAARDPFAKVKVTVGWKGQVQAVKIDFILGGGRDPEGTEHATED